MEASEDGCSLIYSRFLSQKHRWMKKIVLDCKRCTIVTRFFILNFVCVYKEGSLGKRLMTMMINCFCCMVDRRKTFSLISRRDHCRRPSPSRISDTLWAGFEPAQSLSSGFVGWSCAVVITTTPQRLNQLIFMLQTNLEEISQLPKMV